MVDFPPRRSLRTNQLSVDQTGQVWQFRPPNLVQVPGPVTPPPESPPETEPEPPDETEPEPTRAAPVREPPREREPEPKHRRRR